MPSTPESVLALDALLTDMTNNTPHEDSSLVKKIITFFQAIPVKFLLFVLIVVIIVTSDIFGEQILRKVPGATKTSSTAPTIKGSIVQGAVASIAMLAITIFDQLGVL
jgi:hypothetical protein